MALFRTGASWGDPLRGDTDGIGPERTNLDFGAT